MKCQRHSNDDAVGVCVECGSGVCHHCQVTVQGKIYCRVCVESVLSPRLESRDMAEEIKLKDPASAAAMSMLHPGLGQLYNGDIRKGIVLVVSNVCAVILCILICLAIHWIVGVLMLLIAWGTLWGYGIWDAYQYASQFNENRIRRGGIQIDGISEFSASVQQTKLRAAGRP
jgi:TM2 domain-containing membrane protein YozV